MDSLGTAYAEVEKEALVLDRHIREGKFQRSLSLVAAFSGLLGGLEVTLEHYRGSYGQRIMYTPVALSSVLFAAGIGGALSRKAARKALPIASAGLLVDGVIGFGYHIRGIHRKPGGWRIPVANIVMGPPLFAPLLLGIGGFLGLIASQLRPEESTDSPEALAPAKEIGELSLPERWLAREHALAMRIRQGRFQKLLCVATATSGTLNGFESLYSHYKSNFATPAQWVPVVLTPPIVITSLGAIGSERVARTMLPLVSIVGLAAGAGGFYYHLRGVLRRPGGLKHAVYNLVYGPPVFAPLLFSATGFMGLLASRLRRG